MTSKNKSTDTAEEARAEKEQPFLSHLFELRDRLLRIVVVVLVLCVALLPVASELYYFLALPVLSNLPEGSQMIATGSISPVFTPFKLAIVTSVFIAIPYILYQAWSFIAPGLYKHEKRLAFPLLVSSIILFYLGMLFANFVVFRLVFDFTVGMVPEGVEYRPDIANYLDFALKMFFAFGLAFEVPIATILLVLTGMTTPESLTAKRPYIIVGTFVIGMLLTPPDIISQTLLAVPMWLLFEVGIFFSRLLLKRREADAKEREMSEGEMDDEFDKAIAEEEKLNQQSKE